MTKERGIVTQTQDGVIVAVHVQPRAGVTAVRGQHGDALRIRVAAPPVDGRATEEARRALADALNVSPASIALVSGEKSRLKRFLVSGCPLNEVRRRIDSLVAPEGDR
jgi:uncharacterized protein (TIGR00251 family)